MPATPAAGRKNRRSPLRPSAPPLHPAQRQLTLESLESRELLALVSYWSGDNTAVDSISGNNGTLQNGASYAAGQVNQAFSFDGVDDRDAVADSPNLALTQSLSIEAWIKVNAIPTHDHGEILFRGDSRPGLDPYSLAIEPNGQLHFLINDAANNGASVQASVPLGQFVYVAATLDDATGIMSLYENGVLLSQTTTTIRPFGALDPTQQPGVGIGNATSNYNAPFSGLIDELKLYDDALTADQVLADFNSQKGALSPSIAIADTTATEGDVNFNVSQGDLVSQSNNGGLTRSSGMAIGPDGNLYVSSLTTNEVLRYDAATGVFLGTFVTSGSGGLVAPATGGLIFRPDGKLYVLSRDANSVLRYDASTGAFLDTFVPSGSGGLGQPRGMAFGNDGNLYITSTNTNQVLEYSGATGAFLRVFVSAGSGGLGNPRSIAFGPDGNLYVSSTGNSVLRYNGATGAFMNAFIANGAGGLSAPGDFVFTNGSLYVPSQQTNQILRYDAATGAFLDAVDPANIGNLDSPIGLLLAPTGTLLVGNNSNVARYSASAAAVFSLSLSIPWPSAVSVNYTTADGTAMAGSDYVANAGTVTFAPGQIVQTVAIGTIDNTAREPTEAFTVTLSNPSGAALSRSAATGTILDNDTRFHVVNDSATSGTPDGNYDYTTSGGSNGSYSLGTGNTAPRGAASTATGDKMWVVDANKNVYVYSTSGVLQGSWAAGSLPNKTNLQGITVSGNDVWIVDAQGDKVYKYTGAASRLSGSQTAASSFSLNSSNTSATDMVTDGTSIWVVDNGAKTDKVFKYTVGGSLLGSWTISGGGGSPTGITIDPTNVSNIWIVDNATDRVYQFDAAASRTSGSQSPSTSFVLAAGNTNPQGIADPPTVGGTPAYDSALLTVIGELDNVLGPGKKRK